jgi:hypothetical protein
MRKPLFLLLLSVVSYTLSAQTQTPINECIVENGELKAVRVDYNPSTGEKTVVVNGVRKKLDDVYPLNGTAYAAGKVWFINNERISFKGKSYIKYGLPRVLGVTEVIKIGENDGITIFAEPGKELAEVIYLPVRRGCEFQPYQLYCGEMNLTTGVEEIGKGKTFTVKSEPKDIKGKLTYKWTVSSGQITKGQGTKQITVSTKDAAIGHITITLEVTTAGNCPVKGYKWVKVVAAPEPSQSPQPKPKGKPKKA